MSLDVLNCPTAENSLSDKQRAAIELLLQGQDYQDISKSLEIDRRTLYRWRKDELFSEELAERRRALSALASERLESLVHPAIDVLRQQLADRFDRTRFRAATAILRLAKCNQQKS